MLGEGRVGEAVSNARVRMAVGVRVMTGVLVTEIVGKGEAVGAVTGSTRVGWQLVRKARSKAKHAEVFFIILFLIEIVRRGRLLFWSSPLWKRTD